MIAYLKGSVLKKDQKATIINVNGVGYEVFLKNKDIANLQINEFVEFFIHSYIKEDALDLYGFVNPEELAFFKQLLQVSGVGPRTAMSVMSLAEVLDLKRAITSGNPSFLQQVSGIGKKTAERLVVELKEKFIDEVSADGALINTDQQVISALVSLGYKEREVMDMTRGLELEGDLSDKIKQVLKNTKK
ncbi:MAG: Holliday junction branch migration protein RuvA [Patescibacteria group bacterium]|jgi:Holliday junction DNA helicase RuvA